MPAGPMNDIDLGNLSDRELLLLTAQHVNELCGHVAALNNRTTKLEQWRSQAVGALAILAILVSAAVSWLVGHI